jgi:carbamate kinase
VVLTDVDAVRRDFGTPQERPLSTADADELRAMRFPAGSMAPKVEACIRFVTATGRPAAIGALRDAPAVLAGTAGTTITHGGQPSTVTDSGQPATHEGTARHEGAGRHEGTARHEGAGRHEGVATHEGAATTARR